MGGRAYSDTARRVGVTADPGQRRLTWHEAEQMRRQRRDLQDRMRADVAWRREYARTPEAIAEKFADETVARRLAAGAGKSADALVASGGRLPTSDPRSEVYREATRLAALTGLPVAVTPTSTIDSLVAAAPASLAAWAVSGRRHAGLADVGGFAARAAALLAQDGDL